MWRGKRTRFEVDVIPGVLPLLLGRQWGVEHKLVADIESGDVFAKVGNDYELVARNDKSGLVFVSLFAEVNLASLSSYKQVLSTVVDDGETSTADEAELVKKKRTKKPKPSKKGDQTGADSSRSEPEAEVTDVPEEEKGTDSEPAEAADSEPEEHADRDGEVAEESEIAAEVESSSGVKGGEEENAEICAAEKKEKKKKEPGKQGGDKEKETEKETEEQSEKGNEELPKRLRLTNAQLEKIHRKGHRNATSLMRFLTGTLQRKQKEQYKSGLEELKSRIEKVVERCEGCNRCAPRVPKGTVVPRSDLSYLDRVWVDVLVLDRASNFYALGIIDDTTGDTALQFMEGHSHEAVQDAYEERWSSIRGLSGVLVSDRGRELLEPTTIEYFDKQGSLKEHTAAYDSDAHGRIERYFATIRWTIDRVAEDKRKPTSAKEWKRVLWGAENSARNEVQRGGFSSSQRAWGRGTSMSIDPVDATLATDGEAETTRIRRILELQDTAREAYFHARSSRALGQIMKEKAQPEARDFSVGEAVLYRRPASATGGQKSQWRGPAVVSAVVPSLSGSAVQYAVSHGGVLHSVGANDLRGWRESKVGDRKPLVLPESVSRSSQGLPERRAPEEADEERRTEAGQKQPKVPANEDDEQERVAQALAVEATRVRRPGRPKIRPKIRPKPKTKIEKKKKIVLGTVNGPKRATGNITIRPKHPGKCRGTLNG